MTHSGDWLKEKLKTKPTKKRKKIFKKTGPRDIGRIECNKGWTPIKLTKTEELKLNCGASFLQERSRYKSKKTRSRKKSKIRKPGPRDIGKNDKWKQAPIKRRKSASKYTKLKRIKIKSCMSAPSNLKIIFSPNNSPSINEVIFIGYSTPKPQTATINKSKMAVESPIELAKPQSARFTFGDIKSPYKPHRIKWTSKSCNDTPQFTFSDESESDENEEIHENDCKQDEKCIQINKLLSALLACEEDESNEDFSGDANDNNCTDTDTKTKTKTVKTPKPNYTIVIDDIKQNEKGDNVYSGCIESTYTNIDDENDDEDDEDDGGELLFDFSSFLSNLKKIINDNNQPSSKPDANGHFCKT